MCGIVGLFAKSGDVEALVGDGVPDV